MPASLDDDVIRDGEALSSRPFRNAGRAGRQLSLCGTPEKSTYRQMSLSERSSIRVEEIIPAARVAIQVFVDRRLLKVCVTEQSQFILTLTIVFCCFFSDHGGGRLHLHRGLLHAADLGGGCRPLGSGRQPSANQGDPRFPPAPGSSHPSQQHR